MKYQASRNFTFLAEYDPRLVAASTSAERALSIDDAVGALVHLRRFGEHLAEILTAAFGFYASSSTDQHERLRLLRRQRVDERVLDMFHSLRKNGNRAAHEGIATQSIAFHSLKLARELGIWFHRTVGKNRNFKAGPFVPPEKFGGDTAELRKEIENLIAEAEAREEERDQAQAQIEAEVKRRLGVEAAAKQVLEEKEFFEAYAEEQEANRADDQAALEAARKRIAELEAKANSEKLIRERQVQAEQASPAVLNEQAQRGRQAAAKIELTEQETRLLIDEQLQASGWEADTLGLRYSQGVRPQKGKNLAIAEWPTENGPADYALFVGLKAVAVVEAKRRGKDVSAALEQSKRYSRGFREQEGVELDEHAPWGDYRIPFLYSTNGRPYIEQLRLKSGIWQLDARRKTNISGPLRGGWPTPDGLKKKLRQNIDEANSKLSREPTDYLGLRYYQVAAIKAVEEAIGNEQKRIMLAMATGTGKTRTAIGLIYRLLKANRFRRVLFLVDRSVLGEQTKDAFEEVEIENLQTFGQIFGVEGLKTLRPEPSTRLHISTVQGLVRRIFDAGEPESAPKIDDYDCIIVDECHRGYGLDQELSEEEMTLTEYGIRSQNDYISKYRRVLEHFDAVLIGLTATPAKHTASIFGRPVYSYGYRKAVIDGYLCDHEPPYRIETKLSKEGIQFEKGQEVTCFDPESQALDLVEMEDELEIDVAGFNKRVVAESFNREICRYLAKELDPDMDEKTLIFAATDHHADQLVQLLKEAYIEEAGEIEDDMIVKITGSADGPSLLTRRFKNEVNPKIVVTVDLLTTGVDVPKISNLVFVRVVRSRILYDQMIGRATRRCDEIGKEFFRIYDAVGIYDALRDVTEMRPVVQQAKISFRQLLTELEVVTEDEAARQHVLDQLVTKLQRRQAVLKGELLDMFEAVAGMSPDELVTMVREGGPQVACDFFKTHDQLLGILERSGPGKPLLISDAEDSFAGVSRGYGEASRPEDYLDAFANYIQSNLNILPALEVVATRPKELSSKALRELRMELANQGFTEANLRAAWSEAKQVDVAAGVMGFIRQAAIGDPLKSFALRVDEAVEKLKTKHSFEKKEKKWLDRIATSLKEHNVVDRDVLERGQFKADGGFEKMDKRFKGQLEAHLEELHGYVWAKSA